MTAPGTGRRPLFPVIQPAPVAPPRPAPVEQWRSPWKHVQRWRKWTQIAFLALTILVAVEFTRFCLQALAGAPLTAARPSGIEAFLPIAALVGARQWLLTGRWDAIHPAGLTFLFAALAGAFFARRAFCSWVCPVGTLSTFLEWVRLKVLRMSPRSAAPKWLRVVGVSPKYVLLAFFVLSISSMPLGAVQEFLYSPFNLSADAKLLDMWRRPTTLTITVTLGLAALSVLVRHGWCRSLCPYGALLGIAGAASPFRIVRNLDACNDCGACTRACGMGLRVADKVSVHSIECSSCLSCVAACNVKGALDVRAVGAFRVRPWLMPLGALVALAVAYGVARQTGAWESIVSPRQFAESYRMTFDNER